MNFKHVILHSLLILSFLPLVGFAVSPDDILNGKPKNEATSASSSVGMYFQFCDIDPYRENIEIVTSPGVDYPICIVFKNGSDQDQTLEVKFTDGQPFEKNGPQVLCSTASREFTNYTIGMTGQYTVPANSDLEVRGELNFPASVAGSVYGCVSVSKVSEDAAQGAAGKVAMARSISAFVDSNISVGLEVVPPEMPQGLKSISSNKKVFIGKQDNILTAVLGLDNVGSLNENVTADISMTDILGNTLMYASGVNTIVPPQRPGKLSVELPEIPWYKMSYTLKFDITHQAESSVITEFITEDMLQPETITVTATFFLFPWWLVAVLIGLLILWKIAGRMAEKSRQRRRELEELRNYVHDHEGGQQQ